jgi:hypothetical protein
LLRLLYQLLNHIYQLALVIHLAVLNLVYQTPGDLVELLHILRAFETLLSAEKPRGILDLLLL